MLPFTSELNNQSIFITTDADLLVFSKNPHIPNLEKGEQIKFYSTYEGTCCEFIKIPKGYQKVKHYYLQTIAASIETWRDIMGNTWIFIQITIFYI